MHETDREAISENRGLPHWILPGGGHLWSALGPLFALHPGHLGYHPVLYQALLHPDSGMDVLLPALLPNVEPTPPRIPLPLRQRCAAAADAQEWPTEWNRGDRRRWREWPSPVGPEMVSLAAELNPLYMEALRKVPESQAVVEKHLLSEVMPRLRDVVSYSYCYLGIMTGPFYRYKIYQDWLQEGSLQSIPSLAPMVKCLRLVPLYGVAFLLLSGVFPLEYTRTAAFARAGFPYRLAYTAAIFLVFRLRFYVAWTLAEASCMAAGFGAYPVEAQSRPGNGPTIQAQPSSDAPEYDYVTIQNIDPYNTDFCASVKDGMKYWNMTVQWWLANYIYRRAPLQGRLLRIGWTMLVSAFWHGLHPGYYLSFLTIPLCVAAEGSMEKGVRSRLGAWGRWGYDWLQWFWKMRAYDYMCAGFVLLNLPDTLTYWRGLYFYQHLLALALIGLGYLCTPRTPSQTRPPIHSCDHPLPPSQHPAEDQQGR
ncbi:lysophospholipid acyltransferase 7 isoform X3 [Narcine bancroftii]|uniref:lysophospholipid acyltransferase 7 isoform X3 n=1 Tax=Narcine bancroftii TaxID=1343680 RepID=UPI00383149B6